MRADQIDWAEGQNGTHWFAPIVADAEAGFGGPLNAYELMKSMIEAGAAGVHYEDQLSSEKKCGHLGGKVLVPTHAVRPHAERGAARGRRPATCRRARRAHRRARAALLTSDVDEYDREFVTGERTAEGFFRDPRRHRRRDLARPRVRAVRRPRLVRDLDAGPRRGEGVRRRDPRASSPASCSRTTARRRSTGASISTTSRSRRSRSSSTTGATASSSSRSPASTRSTPRCSSSRAATRPSR